VGVVVSWLCHYCNKILVIKPLQSFPISSATYSGGEFGFQKYNKIKIVFLETLGACVLFLYTEPLVFIKTV
jgi:hypothetical protein